MNYKTIAIVIAALAVQVFSFTLGYNTGVDNTHREAYENGLMYIQRLPGGERQFTWIETHKLGYDYDQ